MDLRNYMKILKLDEAELGSRRAFFELTDADLERLADLRPFAERHTDAVVESFYQLLLSHPETKKFFPDEATGRCDLAYVEDRLRVGIAHERIGLSTKWYLGAYRKYMQDILRSLLAELGDETRAREAFESIQKLVYFDVVIACDTYFAAKMDALERHQAAIRELSTPVIRVYDRVLLLPLIGAIDSLRADQIMDSVLLKVTEAQARCIIIDIAGVAVVDTKVADNLVKTTAAVRLLGAETILTGITAQVARTIVQLGVDISAMHTRSRLSEGIELALSLLGNTIQPRAARERKAASKRTRFEAE
jgi:rsbT co-antagonist protein RsbR